MNTTSLQNPVELSTGGVFAALLPELQRALADEEYRRPTPIQERSIPPLLDGRDLLGSAQTGTGKTAAFVLPILQRLALSGKEALRGKPRVLILAPTRELASQIGNSISAYGRHLHITAAVIFGGVKQHSQVDSLKRGRHIVVATPGRLLDLMNQGHLSLVAIETFVLDEADRMLDMGFLPDIRKVIGKLPAQRQSLFFSATLAPEVVKLAKSLVRNPVEIAISPEIPAVEEIEQTVFFIDQEKKINLLIDLLNDASFNKVLVFTKMKYGADRISDKLNRAGITSEAIHGDKAQNARTRTLDNFKREKMRVLVATDIAARGIDVDRISHVINYDLPNEPETYIHRIGRTARAGAKGCAASFCSAEERNFLHEIEKLIRTHIPVWLDHEHNSDKARFATGADAKPKPRQQRDNRSRQRQESRLSKDIFYSTGKRQHGRNPVHGRRRYTGPAEGKALLR
ncbi:MAG: DEAD/DEAH box helicase [Chitinispirillaceae bacterium]|nr:DEAD/DEAH box helicase [Chitinispirillaceae bacterium]